MLRKILPTRPDFYERDMDSFCRFMGLCFRICLDQAEENEGKKQGPAMPEAAGAMTLDRKRIHSKTASHMDWGGLDSFFFSRCQFLLAVILSISDLEWEASTTDLFVWTAI